MSETGEIAPEEPNLVSKASVELFVRGEYPGIAAWGVPMTQETAQYLGIEPERARDMTFDFIHMSTDEVASQASYSAKENELYPDTISAILNQKPLATSVHNGQAGTLRHLMDKVFYLGNKKDMKLAEDLKQDIAQSPNKPFLVIYGHGLTIKGELLKDLWSIGDYNRQYATDLLEILEELDNDKYSAILLVSCNPGKIGLEDKGYKTPIYYKMGTAGITEKEIERK